MDFRGWLLQNLKFVESLARQPEWSESHYTQLRQIVAEARRKAAAAGLPTAVEACAKTGEVNHDDARKILAACLSAVGAVPMDPNRPLSVEEAAQMLNVSPRKVYQLCQQRKIRHLTGPTRFLLADLEAYLGR